MSTDIHFAQWFDAACVARWKTNTEAAAAIARGLRYAGLSRTGRIQIGRWRTGRTAPPLAIQRELARYMRRLSRRAKGPPAS